MPAQNENRPRGPVSASTSILPQRQQFSLADDALDYGHAGHLSGYSTGFAHGQRFADEDRALAIIHAYAAKWTEAAVHTATAHHGAGWASEIERACYPDEVA